MRTRRRQIALLSALGLAMGATALAGVAQGGVAPAGTVTWKTNLVSKSPAGDSPFPDSRRPSISADGRYIAFDSQVRDLVAGDTNDASDVFLRDTKTGTTTLVSVGTTGPADQGASGASISSDGRHVAFNSSSTNLVGGDTNGQSDIFVRDMQTGTTTMISVSTAGGLGNAASGDPSISEDGRFVAFRSDASNLVAGDSNGTSDIFVRDTLSGTTTRVSTGAAGEANAYSQSPRISSDGRHVAFASGASNLVAGDSNGFADLFVRDTQDATTTLVSTSTAGDPANSGTFNSTISADGRFIAFDSTASNLVGDDGNGSTSDIFLRDTQSDTTTRISRGVDSAEPNGASHSPSISPDGRYIAFSSAATNLTDGEANGGYDVFRFDRQTAITTLASTDMGPERTTHDNVAASISADGGRIAFVSEILRADLGHSHIGDVFLAVDVGASPTLTLPSDLTKATAAGADAVPVSYSVSATDEEDGTLSPSCSPASGTSFAVGTTRVTCTVKDSDGNAASGSFSVTVTATPAEKTAPSPAKPRLVLGMAGPIRAKGGAIVGYKFKVSNRGKALAKHARLRTVLPKGLLHYSAGSREASNRRYSRKGRRLTWNLGRIRVGQSKLVILRTRAARGATRRVTLPGRAWASGLDGVTSSRRTLIVR